MSDTPAEVCANCGKEASDAIKLKNCTACRLVKYCSVDCQKIHRKQHKTACKKRAAELKDEKLFSLGQERLEGDFCLLCTLPIPLLVDDHSNFFVCCMKRVCDGCNIAAQKRGFFDCPFCRTPLPEDINEATLAMVQKRVDAKDPAAILFLGNEYYVGGYGLGKNVQRAIELWTEAAELGSTMAQSKLARQYMTGEGVTQDQAKSFRFLEEAAMKGQVAARHNLGCLEDQKGNYERAARHYLIAAKMGYHVSLGQIKEMFAHGEVTEGLYAEALKGYQDSVNETKSPERDDAKASMRRVG